MLLSKEDSRMRICQLLLVVFVLFLGLSQGLDAASDSQSIARRQSRGKKSSISPDREIDLDALPDQDFPDLDDYVWRGEKPYSSLNGGEPNPIKRAQAAKGIWARGTDPSSTPDELGELYKAKSLWWHVRGDTSSITRYVSTSASLKAAMRFASYTSFRDGQSRRYFDAKDAIVFKIRKTSRLIDTHESLTPKYLPDPSYAEQKEYSALDGIPLRDIRGWVKAEDLRKNPKLRQKLANGEEPVKYFKKNPIYSEEAHAGARTSGIHHELAGFPDKQRDPNDRFKTTQFEAWQVEPWKGLRGEDGFEAVQKKLIEAWDTLSKEISGAETQRDAEQPQADRGAAQLPGGSASAADGAGLKEEAKRRAKENVDRITVAVKQARDVARSSTTIRRLIQGQETLRTMGKSIVEARAAAKSLVQIAEMMPNLKSKGFEKALEQIAAVREAASMAKTNLLQSRITLIAKLVKRTAKEAGQRQAAGDESGLISAVRRAERLLAVLHTAHVQTQASLKKNAEELKELEDALRQGADEAAAKALADRLGLIQIPGQEGNKALEREAQSLKRVAKAMRPLLSTKQTKKAVKYLEQAQKAYVDSKGTSLQAAERQKHETTRAARAKAESPGLSPWAITGLVLGGLLLVGFTGGLAVAAEGALVGAGALAAIGAGEAVADTGLLVLSEAEIEAQAEALIAEIEAEIEAEAATAGAGAGGAGAVPVPAKRQLPAHARRARARRWRRRI
ncbi:putative enterotoxin [Cordyceps sp. RAO-2017]|nr:putative enterotoxin [Cordyceps sp. RAO-2017]